VNWYRVVIGKDSKVLSCTLVESAGDDTVRVYHVLSESLEKARLSGKARYNAYMRQKVRDRRALLKAEQRCRCGRKLPKDYELAQCEWCRELRGVHRERARARQRGEDVPPADWKATREERRELDRDEHALEVLLKVKRAWERCTTNGQFTAWLNEQIGKLQKGRAA